MTLLQLKYFLEAARTGSFTMAAKNLFVAQSSLSYAIHELEHELGVPLFVRSAGKKKIELTEYGKKYLPYSEQIFKLLDSLAVIRLIIHIHRFHFSLIKSLHTFIDSFCTLRHQGTMMLCHKTSWSWDICGNHWNSQSIRLQKNQAQSLIVRGQNKQITSF